MACSAHDWASRLNRGSGTDFELTLDFKMDELRNELKNLELRLTIKLAIIVFAVLTFFELVNRFLGS